MKRGIALAVAALLLLGLLAGCDFGALLTSDADEARAAKKTSVVRIVPGFEAEMVEGSTGPGSLYELYRPFTLPWNGTLVIYAHGYMNPALPVMLPSLSGEGEAVAALREAMLPLRYGVAYSSYSENGWAVKDAITRTRQLIGLYTSRFGKPRYTYIVGASMGAAVAAAMAEKCPELIDGVVAISGPLAGPIFQFEHVLTTRVLFDYFYRSEPPLIEGDAYHVPEGLTQAFVEQVVSQAASQSDMGLRLAQIAAIDQLSMPYTSGYELGAMFVGALTFSVTGTNDALDRTHGHIPVGNMDVVYSDEDAPTNPYPMYPIDFDTLNRDVDRFEPTPDAENYMEHWYVPTGDLRVPIVTLHNIRDPAVPYSHEAAFEKIVADAGKSSLLEHYPVVGEFGHGAVTPEEVMGAFQKLLDMVGP